MSCAAGARARTHTNTIAPMFLSPLETFLEVIFWDYPQTECRVRNDVLKRVKSVPFPRFFKRPDVRWCHVEALGGNGDTGMFVSVRICSSALCRGGASNRSTICPAFFVERPL
jgi:hypothetical protein